tara:strand:+ start:606 stop:1046 length:441 start_codon:yes stop_codon:yes gene_type:complete
MISIDVEIIDKFLSIEPDKVKNLANSVISQSEIQEGILTIIFTQEELLREMKKRFFREDVYTDIIAFQLNEKNERFEGEIYISPKIASENAKKFGQSVSNELARLICHGCLHLLGYKDGTESEKLNMRSEEDRFLKKFSFEEILNK